MPYTDLEIKDYAKKLLEKGATNDIITEFVKRAKNEQTPVRPVAQPVRPIIAKEQPKIEKPLFKNASPFSLDVTQIPSRVKSAVETVGSVVKGGYDRGRTGMEEIIGATTGDKTYDPVTKEYKETPKGFLPRLRQGASGLKKVVTGTLETATAPVYAGYIAGAGALRPEIVNATQGIKDLYVKSTNPEIRQKLDTIINNLPEEAKDLPRSVLDLVGFQYRPKDVFEKPISKVLDDTVKNVKTFSDNVLKLKSQLDEATTIKNPAMASKVLNNVYKTNTSPMFTGKTTVGNEFKRMTGEDFGNWQSNRGLVDTPVKSLQNNIDYYLKAKSSVDDWFSTKGQYFGGYNQPFIKVMTKELKKLYDRPAIRVSVGYQDDIARFDKIQRDLTNTGINLDDIQFLKRKLEDNKLGYWKENNSKAVTDLTALDNTARQFLTNETKNLGFNNYANLNKEIQGAYSSAKIIAKKLGADTSTLDGMDMLIASHVNVPALMAVGIRHIFKSPSARTRFAKWIGGKDISVPKMPNANLKHFEALPSPVKPMSKRLQLTSGNPNTTGSTLITPTTGQQTAYNNFITNLKSPNKLLPSPKKGALRHEFPIIYGKGGRKLQPENNIVPRPVETVKTTPVKSPKVKNLDNIRNDLEYLKTRLSPKEYKKAEQVYKQVKALFSQGR